MTDKLIKYLEKKGFSHLEVTLESDSVVELEGKDSRGMFLEFRYNKKGNYILDRGVGSKYWDTLGEGVIL